MNGNGTTTLSDALQFIEQAVSAAPLEGLPRLMGNLECLRAIADLRLRTGTLPPSTSPMPEPCYLTVEETAERFHVAPKWLYRHKRQMPHSQPSRKVLLFPEQAITKWFASRKQA